jgi:hypothetical protein
MSGEILQREIAYTEYKRYGAMNYDILDKTVPLMCFSRHYMLVELLERAHKIFSDNNIKYVLTGGCAIGLYRHNGSFVPWDDDVDLTIMGSDRETIGRLFNLNDDIYLCSGGPYGIDKVRYKYDRSIKRQNPDEKYIHRSFLHACDWR